MVHRDLIDFGINNLKKVIVSKVEDCIDKMMNHIHTKWKGDPKIQENKVVV